jgi:carboxylesterase
LYELWRLTVQAKQALRRVSAPTLIVQSKADPRIEPAIAERALAELNVKDKKLVWTEGGGHIITVDYGREKVFAEVTSWIEQYDT